LRVVGTRSDSRDGWFYRIQQLSPSNEHDAGARDREHPAACPRIGSKIMLAALHRAERDCIDHQPRLEARLDGEKSADLA